MALDDLNGIANVQFSTVESITWGTAADWDAAVSEAGVVHEDAQPGYDLPGAGTVTIGYPTHDEGGSALEVFYPMHETSGSTINDVTGNGNDASTKNSPTLGANGILGRNAVDYTASNSEAVVGEPTAIGQSFTLVSWIKTKNASWTDNGVMWSARNANGFIKHPSSDSTDTSMYVVDNSDSYTKVGEVNASNVDSWHMYIFVWDHNNGEARGYWDNTQDFGPSSASVSRDSGASADHAIGWDEGQSDRYLDGYTCMYRWYNRPLSDAECKGLYDDLFNASLTTDTKSLSSSGQPDLTGLSYALNDGSVDIDVIGSPGTADEEVVNSGSLDGTQTSASLSWSASHTDFRVRPNLSISAITDAPPTVSTIELQA